MPVLEPNVLASLESEVAVGVTPNEFENLSSITIGVKDAHSVLSEMGILSPTRIVGKEALAYELANSVRLTSSQILEFVSRSTLRSIKK